MCTVKNGRASFFSRKSTFYKTMNDLESAKNKLSGVIKYENLPKDRNANYWNEIRTRCDLNPDEYGALQNAVWSEGGKMFSLFSFFHLILSFFLFRHFSSFFRERERQRETKRQRDRETQIHIIGVSSPYFLFALIILILVFDSIGWNVVGFLHAQFYGFICFEYLFPIFYGPVEVQNWEKFIVSITITQWSAWIVSNIQRDHPKLIAKARQYRYFWPFFFIFII
jgi:hypothetical protein